MLTQARLKELLSYDPETGEFRWRVQRLFVMPGTKAGWIGRDGYVGVTVDCKGYKAHRLAWLYMTGEFPRHQVDHKDCDRTNNRFANLREATNQQNMRNSVPYGGRRWKGISASGKKFRAQINCGGKVKYLGTFATEEEAHEAYCRAAQQAGYGEFFRAA